jgi:hypothetical protein
MIRVAAARPVAQRHRGGCAAFARVNIELVAGSEQAEVEEVDLNAGLFKHLLRPLDHAEGLGDFAGAGAVVAGRSADQQHPALASCLAPARLRFFDLVLGLQPFDRHVVIGVGIAWASLAGYRRLAAFFIRLPGNRFDARNRFIFGTKGRVDERFDEALMKLAAR